MACNLEFKSLCEPGSGRQAQALDHSCQQCLAVNSSQSCFRFVIRQPAKILSRVWKDMDEVGDDPNQKTKSICNGGKEGRASIFFHATPDCLSIQPIASGHDTRLGKTLRQNRRKTNNEVPLYNYRACRFVRSGLGTQENPDIINNRTCNRDRNIVCAKVSYTGHTSGHPWNMSSLPFLVLTSGRDK